MTQLGIAIVHYHSEHLLAHCLHRLHRSEFQDYRLAIVDNGSDGSLHEMTKEENITIISPGTNLGFAAGTNKALEHLPTDCPFVLLLNPDVLIEPTTLGDLLELFSTEETRLGAVTCKLLLPDGRIDPACRRSRPTLLSGFAKYAGLDRLFPGNRWFGRYNLTFLDPDSPHSIESGTGAFLLIRREALRAIGGTLDERFFLYGEDLDLCRRLKEANYELLFWPHTTAWHVKGSNRIRQATTTMHFYRAMWIYYRKWGHHRHNPLILGPLAASLIILALWEIGVNELKRRWKGPRLSSCVCFSMEDPP